MNIIKYLQAQGIDTRKGCQWLVKHQLVQINGNTVVGDKTEVQPENVRQHLRATWPAPISFVLPAHPRVLPLLRGNQRNRLAVRVPNHAVARELCRIAGTPLVSTSCNQSGKRACKSEREVRRLFGRKLWIVGGRVGKRKQPSEIVDWAENRRLR